MSGRRASQLTARWRAVEGRASTFLLGGALGAGLGGAMWYLSLPLAGAYVFELMFYPYNFLAVMMLVLFIVAPLASVVGAVAGWVIWLLCRGRRVGLNVLLRAAIAAAITTAAGAPLAVILIPRPHMMTPGQLTGYRLFFGVLTGLLAGCLAGSETLRRAVYGR